MIGPGDFGNVLLSQVALDPVNHAAHFPGIQEENFAASVFESVVPLIAREKPEADRDLRGIKKLAGQRDDAVHKVGLNDGFANLPFAGLIGGHRAVGGDEAGHAVRSKMMDDVLNPGEIGIAGGRHTVFPAHVIAQPLATPIAHVERKIGQYIIGLEVFVQVAMERVGWFGTKIPLNATDGEIHPGQTPGGRIALLPKNADVADTPAVGFDKFLALDEEAACTVARVVHSALVRHQHGDQDFGHALRGVKLPALLAFGAGKLAEKIFIDPPDDVLGTALLVAQADGGNEVNDAAEALFVQVRTGVFLGQHTFERWVVFFHCDHGVIEIFADCGLLGTPLQIRPTRNFVHPENVFGGVFVTVFGVGAFFLHQRGVFFLESVGDVFEEDEAQDNMLVFGGIQVAAEFIRSRPEGGLEPKGTARIPGQFAGCACRHAPSYTAQLVATQQKGEGGFASGVAGFFSGQSLACRL